MAPDYYVIIFAMDTRGENLWYVAGLAFECLQCGRCCAGPEEGYIWIEPAEIQRAATFLKITPQQFADRYVRREGQGLTIIENRRHDCIFLSGPGKAPGCGGGRGCAIYEVRPMQCRTWPYWKFNLSSPDAWAFAASRCPGINRGPLHPLEEILPKRDISPT